MTTSPPSEGVCAIRDAVASGRRRAVDVVADAIAAARGPATAYGGVIEIDADAALTTAAAVDAARAAGGVLGPLAGVPITIKDNIAVSGWELTAGSRMLAGYRSPFDATVCARLRAAGAILLGRTNLDEFGMGSATTSGVAGAARNPWDDTRVAGGSSGGSAVAVATGAGAASLGTDTGGSVRLPAALCGVVGLKPTYGRVPRYGVVAYASSLDQVGVLARSVDDAGAVLGVISGPCDHDATSAQVEAFVPPSTAADAKGLRVGVPAGFADHAAVADPAVAEAFARSLDDLRAAGADVVEVVLPDMKAAVAAYYVIATAEASTNLSRYDGVRYGRRADAEGRDLAGMIAQSRSEGFGPEVQRRILLGTFALSAGYHDAFFDRACRVRRLLADAVAAAFGEVDLLAMPTSPVRAWPLATDFDDPTSVYAMDIFTVLANLCGLPALSVPCAMAASPLPIGTQLLAPAFEEARLIIAGRALEQARGTLPWPAAATEAAR